MAFLNLFGTAMTTPSGVWEWFILKVFGFISAYGWRILVFTIILKLVLFPLDLFQRVKMFKNQKITERLAPDIEKLQKQYGHDKTLFSQKQMELNRKEGYSYFSSCLPAIITMVIFFWLFAGLNNISAYMNLKQYVELYDKYQVVYTENVNEDESNKDEAIGIAQNAVYSFYYGAEDTKGNQESFLWIKNIWAADVPWKKPILDFDAFQTAIGKFKQSEKNGIPKNVLDDMLSYTTYNNVTQSLRVDNPHNKVNGLLILPILAVGMSFLSQFITTRQQKKSGQVNATGGMGGTMKVMMIMMPIMMGFFSLMYTSAFTIYIVANSTLTILFNLMSTGIISLVGGRDKLRYKGSVVKTEKKKFDKYDASDDKKAKKGKSSTDVVIKYGRPDPKDLVNKDKHDKK